MMTPMLGLLFVISLIAGFIDAIAGGGGLILLPTLLFSGLSPASAIATNKLFNVASSLSSAIRFCGSGNVRWGLFKRMALPSLLGALIGSRLVQLLSHQSAEPVIVGLLALVTLIVVFRPSLGGDHLQESSPDRARSGKQLAQLGAAGLLIGIHDGFFGPGAGIFLIFALIHFGKTSFLRATGTAKIINLLTSLIALFAFIRAGQVAWLPGLVGGLGVTLGSNLGARHAELNGSRLIRPVFIGMAIAVCARLVFAA